MKHRLGVIGYGTMGSWHAANVRDRIGDLDVAAIYDIDEKRREKAEKESGKSHEERGQFPGDGEHGIRRAFRGGGPRPRGAVPFDVYAFGAM